MNHKEHIQQIITDELRKQIETSGYVLCADFRNMIGDRYGFSVTEIAGALDRAFKKLGLCRMRANSTIKRYYGLNVGGYPIIFLRK